MNANMSQPPVPDPVDGRPAKHRFAEGVVLFGLAVALPATPILLILGTNWPAIQLLWIAALIWTVIASFVQALRRGIYHGDWSALMYEETPRNDNDLDYCTRTGRYSYLRIRDMHEALTREAELFLKDHDQNRSRY